MSGYLNNLKNSFANLGKDLLDEYIPIIKPIHESIANASRGVKSDYTSGGMGVITKLISKVPYFNDISKLTNNLFAGIRSGNIYTAYGMGGTGEFNIDDTFSEDENASILDTQAKDVKAGDKLITQSTIDSAEANAKAINTANTKLHIDNKIFFQGFRNELNKGMENQLSSFKALIDFNNDVMRNFTDASLKYYTDSLAVLNDIKRGVSPEEATDGSAASQEDKTWIEMLESGDVIGGLKGLAKNAIGAFDKYGITGSISSALGFALPIYAAAPGEMIKDGIKGIVDKFTSLDELTGLQETLMKPSKWANNIMGHLSLSDNAILRAIGKGGRIIKGQTQYMTDSNFERKNLKWDSESKTALTVVIPTYLSRIVSALTGTPELYYNMNSNRWNTRGQILKDYNDTKPGDYAVQNGVEKLILNNIDKKHVTTPADTSRFKLLMSLLSKGLIKNGYNLEHILNMGLDSNRGKMGLRDLMGVADDAELSNMVDEDFMIAIKSAINKSGNTEDGARLKARVTENIEKYGSKMDKHIKNASADRTASGLIFALGNGNEYVATNRETINGVANPNRQADPTFSGEEDKAHKDKQKLKEMYNEGIYANDEERANANKVFRTDLTPEQRQKLIEKQGGSGFLDILHMLTGNVFTNNKFIDRHFKNNEFVKKMKSGHIFDIDSVISNNVMNPYLDFVNKYITRDMEDKMGEDLTDEQRERMRQEADEKTEELRARLDEIDRDDTMSDEQKKKEKEKIAKEATGSIIDAVGSLFGKGKDKLNKLKENKQVIAAGKIVAAGMGGIVGASVLGGILKGLPGMGAMFGSLGPLLPITLAGLGIAGGVYALKSGMLDSLVGAFKDPAKRKEAIGKLVKAGVPSMFVGGAAGLLTTSLLGAMLPFGAWMAPIMGAAVGIGTAVYSHKSGIMERLFGMGDSKTGDEKMKVGKWLKFFKTMGVTALGIAGTAGLLTAGGGLPLVGGILGLGGGLIANPILFAAASVAGGIMLEKDNIKKRLFGDGAENNSFGGNLARWLFGDKEKNKEGILSRQFKRFGAYLDKSATNISEWFKESIVDNIKIGFKPFSDAVGNIGKGIITGLMGGWDKMSDRMQESMDKGFFKALTVSFEEKVINPIATKISSFFSGFFKIMGGILAAPFKMFASIFAGRNSEDSDPDEEDNSFNPLNAVRRSVDRHRRRRARRAGRGGPSSDNIRNRHFSLFGKGALKDNKMHRFGTGGETYYSQNSNTWGALRVGDSNVKESGCAIACMAMCARYLLDDKNLTPASLVKIAEKHKVLGDGIKPSFFEEVSNKMGLIYKRIPADKLDVKSVQTALNANNRIIALMEKDYNGSTRHYIYIKKAYDKTAIIYDDPIAGKNIGASISEINALAVEYYVFAKAPANKGDKAMVNMVSKDERSLLRRVTDFVTGKRKTRKETANEIMANTSSRLGMAMSQLRGNSVEGSASIPDAEASKMTGLLTDIRDILNSDKDKKPDEKAGKKKKRRGRHSLGNVEDRSVPDDKDDDDDVPDNDEDDSMSEEGDRSWFAKSSRTADILKGFVRLYKRKTTTQERIAKRTNKILKGNLTGVAFNLEYIKRLMVKHYGDLKDTEKPGESSFFKFMKVRGYHPILGFIQDTFEYVGDAFKNVFGGFKDMVVGAFEKTWNFVTRDVIGGVFRGVEKILTGWIPNIIEKVIVKPINALVKGIGNLVSGAFKAIGATLKPLKDAVLKITTDLYGGVKALLKDSYSMMIKTVGFAGKLTAGAIFGLGGMIGQGLRDSKLFGSIFGALGNVLKLTGITKIFAPLGHLFSWTKNKVLGPKKVFIAGGTIDLVKKVDAIGAVGSVDADAYRQISNASNAEASLEANEKNATGGDGGSSNSSGGKKARRNKGASSPNSKPLRDDDKEQDNRNKLQEEYHTRMLNLIGGGAAANRKSFFWGNSGANGTGANGTGANGNNQNNPNNQNNSKPGIMSTVFTTVASMLGLNMLKNVGLKALPKTLLTKVAPTFVKGLGKLALPLLAGGVVAGKGLNLAGDALKWVGADGLGDKVSSAGDAIQTPGVAVVKGTSDWAAEKTGTQAAGWDEVGDGIVKGSYWKLKHKYGIPGLRNAMDADLAKKAAGSKDAVKDLLKNKSVVKFLQANGVSLGKAEIAGALKNDEKLAQVMAKEGFMDSMTKLFKDPKVLKKIVQSTGKKMSEEALEKFIKELGEAAAKQAAKKGAIAVGKTALAYGTGGISIAVFFLIDFAWGWYKAGDYLKVDKPTKIMRFAAAMTNALQGAISSTGWFILLAFIPTTLIAQLVWKLALACFGDDKDKAEFEQKQKAYAERKMREAINSGKHVDKKEINDKLKDTIKDENDADAIKAFGYKHGNYSVVGKEITDHDDTIIRNKMLDARFAMNGGKTASGLDVSGFKAVLDKTTGNTNRYALDTRSWTWLNVRTNGGIDMKLLRDSTRFQEDLRKDKTLDTITISKFKGRFSIAGYNYSEVGCGPEALFQVYKSFGLASGMGQNVSLRSHMAKTASYYQNYIESGQGLPWKYIVDYAVFDGFYAKVLKTAYYDIQAAIYSNAKVIALYTNPDGSSHYIAIVGITTKGSLIIIDPLRSGAIGEGGKDIRSSNGQGYVKPRDATFFRNISSAVAISTSPDISGGYQMTYQLAPNANEIIAKNPLNFDFNKLGTFMDAKSMFMARAWADGDINPEAQGDKKPTNYSFFKDKAMEIHKKYGLGGMMTPDALADVLVKDIYNNPTSGNSSNKLVFSQVKDEKTGTTKYRVMLAKVSRDQTYGIHGKSDSMNIFSDRNTDIWDPSTNKYVPMQIMTDGFTKRDGSGLKLTPLIETPSVDNKSYLNPTVIDVTRKRARKFAQNKPIEAEGGYGSKRPNWVLSNTADKIKNLNKSMNSYSNAIHGFDNEHEYLNYLSNVKAAHSVNVVEKEVKEVIKTDGLEHIMKEQNKLIKLLIDITIATNKDLQKGLLDAISKKGGMPVVSAAANGAKQQSNTQQDNPNYINDILAMIKQS